VWIGSAREIEQVDDLPGTEEFEQARAVLRAGDLNAVRTEDVRSTLSAVASFGSSVAAASNDVGGAG
jgi:hypothetical protein